MVSLIVDCFRTIVASSKWAEYLVTTGIIAVVDLGSNTFDTVEVVVASGTIAMALSFARGHPTQCKLSTLEVDHKADQSYLARSH